MADIPPVIGLTECAHARYVADMWLTDDGQDLVLDLYRDAVSICVIDTLLNSTWYINLKYTSKTR